MASKIFCLHFSTMKTIDVPQVSHIHIPLLRGENINDVFLSDFYAYQVFQLLANAALASSYNQYSIYSLRASLKRQPSCIEKLARIRRY